MLELKLSKINNLTLMVLYASIICISAGVTRQLVKTDDPIFSFPTGSTLLLVIAHPSRFTLSRRKALRSRRTVTQKLRSEALKGVGGLVTDLAQVAVNLREIREMLGLRKTRLSVSSAEH